MDLRVLLVHVNPEASLLVFVQSEDLLIRHHHTLGVFAAIALEVDAKASSGGLLLLAEAGPFPHPRPTHA